MKLNTNRSFGFLNPFDDDAIEQAGISEEIKEQLLELSTDSVLKMQGMGLHDDPEFLLTLFLILLITVH
jgi:hypothetical protein